MGIYHECCLEAVMHNSAAHPVTHSSFHLLP